jgi:Outer membrane protein beta-barrel domain
MKIRTLGFLGLLIFLITSGPARAQGRFEVTPFGGYETSGSYPINVYSQNGGIIAPVDKLRVNDAAAYGTFLDFNLTENAELEFMWNRNNTSFSARNTLTGDYSKAYNSDIDQYQFGGLYMLRNTEHRLRPYVAASIGFTHEGNDGGTPDRTAFAYSVGGGVKYYLSRHLGLRADARFMPTYGNSGNAHYCDPFYGCYTARVANYLDRGSFVGGVIVHF